MPTEYVWGTMRDDVVERCGDFPSGPLEQRILTVFEQHPALVAEGVEHVLRGYERGSVRSVWPVIAKHVEQAVETRRRSSTPVTDSRERDQAVERAKRWLHSTGVHFDREGEIVDELLGPLGSLRAWSGDERLVEQMLDVWRDLRPLGAEVERQAEARDKAWLASRSAQTVRLPKRTPLDELLREHAVPLRPDETLAETLAQQLPNPFVDA